MNVKSNVKEVKEVEEVEEVKPPIELTIPRNEDTFHAYYMSRVTLAKMTCNRTLRIFYNRTSERTRSIRSKT